MTAPIKKKILKVVEVKQAADGLYMLHLIQKPAALLLLGCFCSC